MSLSVAIITKNEEANIRRTLESVKWADEIVIVDSGSTDRTCDIAREFGAKVFVEGWKGFAAQKNSAIDKCSGDWILSLDADEEVSADLATELKGALLPDDSIFTERALKNADSLDRVELIMAVEEAGSISGVEIVGFRVPRKNYFLGKWIRYGGYYPDRKLRIIRKGYGEFESRSVHEDIKLKKNFPSDLQSHLIHHAYPTLSGYIEHMNRYSDLGALMLLEKKQGEREASAESREQSARAKSLATEPSQETNRYSDLGAQMVADKAQASFSITNIVLRPLATFIYNYIFRLGFLDGREGLLLHLYHSVYVSWKYAKAWELSRNKGVKKE
ncbi:MAG TPA: glycosyltransferase family 2 protein [Terriglobales bacterium]|nr:glycosyltransferase family 2 protein [Terriglobales bacterium]